MREKKKKETKKITMEDIKVGKVERDQIYQSKPSES